MVRGAADVERKAAVMMAAACPADAGNVWAVLIGERVELSGPGGQHPARKTGKELRGKVEVSLVVMLIIDANRSEAQRRRCEKVAVDLVVLKLENVVTVDFDLVADLQLRVFKVRQTVCC